MNLINKYIATPVKKKMNILFSYPLVSWLKSKTLKLKKLKINFGQDERKRPDLNKKL